MDLAYTGHKLSMEADGLIHHFADPRRNVIVFSVEQDIPGSPIDLTVDEARRLATSLLRDVGLIEDGAG